MRRLLIVTGALAAVVLLAAIIVPMLIPTALYRDKLIAAVKQSTGHDLGIDGPVSFSVLGGLSLKAQDVSLSGAPGDPTKLAAIKSMQVGVKLVPLMSGIVDVTGVTLDQPAINLRVARDGTTNWAMHGQAGVAKPAATPEETKQSSNPADALQRLRLGAVTIHDGTLSYADARKPGTQTVSKLEADLHWPGMADKLKLTGSLDWRGQTLKFEVDTDAPSQFLQLKPLPVTIKLEAPALSASFTGQVEPGAPVALNGDVKIGTPSVGKLGAWLGATLPGPQGSDGKLSGHLHHQGAVTALNAFQAALGPITVAGDLGINTGGARMLLKGALRFSELDLNPYLPASATPAPGAEAKIGAAPVPAATPAGWSTAPLDFQPLMAADADLTIQTAGLKYRTIVIGATELGVMLHDSQLNTILKKMALYGGTGSGSVTLRAAAEPSLGLQFALQNVAMQPMLTAAIGLQKVSGTGGLNVSVAANGHSQREMIGNLNGTGSFRVVNGAVQGFDLGGLGTSVANAAGEKNAGGETAFSDMSGSFNIVDGLLHNGDLSLASAPVHATGAGEVSLPARTVNYRIDATLLPSSGPVAAGSPNGVQLPVIVSGPWDNLSYRPDFAALLHQKLDTKQLLSSAKGFLKGQPDASGQPAKNPKIGDVLKGLLGGH